MTRYNMNITEYINSTDADERYDFESHVFENIWYKFVKHLPNEEDYAHNSVDIQLSVKENKVLGIRVFLFYHSSWVGALCTFVLV